MLVVRTKPELWHCRVCRTAREALLTKYGKARVVCFHTGFVGVQLTCRHWARVRLDKVQ